MKYQLKFYHIFSCFIQNCNQNHYNYIKCTDLCIWFCCSYIDNIEYNDEITKEREAFIMKEKRQNWHRLES